MKIFKSSDYPSKFFVVPPNGKIEYFDSVEEINEFLEDYTLEEIEQAANWRADPIMWPNFNTH